MSEKPTRRVSAGSNVDDLCRVCRMVRRHTVLAASQEGTPLRVLCDHCGSQHNYRGAPEPAARSTPSTGANVPVGAGAPFPTVSDRERSLLPMSDSSHDPSSAVAGDLETLLRRIIREESGLTPVAPAEKWRGGELVLRPGKEGLQERSWPIETFFHKVVMLRNRLRTLEQQVNGSDLPHDQKLKLQGYITACYGSLTSFNLLFADEEDRFSGSGGRS